MSNAVKICNLALSNIGQSDSIASIDEASTAARMCKLWFDQSRDAVLQEFPWPFATKAIALAQLTGDPPPGWGFAYTYPNDCLFAQRVCTAAGIRALSRAQWLSIDRWDCDATLLAQTKVPFNLQAGTDANPVIIATDLEDAYLYYIKQITNPEVFSPMFVQAFAWKLAAAIALPLTMNKGVAADAATAYRAEVDRAAAQAFNEGVTDQEPVSSSISARW